MKTAKPAMLVVVVLVGVELAAQAPNQEAPEYASTTYGFSIQPPQFPAAGRGSQAVAAIFLAPPENEFAANVNVLVQQVSRTPQEYRDISTKELQAAGLRVNAEQNLKVGGKDAVLFDYEGKQQGRELRFLSLAVFDRHRIVMVTGTSLKDQYAKHEKTFRTCLESLKMEE